MLRLRLMNKKPLIVGAVLSAPFWALMIWIFNSEVVRPAQHQYISVMCATDIEGLPLQTRKSGAPIMFNPYGERAVCAVINARVPFTDTAAPYDPPPAGKMNSRNGGQIYRIE